MLAKKYRLTKSNLIKAVLKKGGSFSCRYFTLFVCKRDTPPVNPRAAIIVSGKISKTAVGRNRGKRVLAAGLQKIWPKLPPKIDLVILGKKPVLRAKTPEVMPALDVFAEKIREMCGN